MKLSNVDFLGLALPVTAAAVVDVDVVEDVVAVVEVDPAAEVVVAEADEFGDEG